MRWLSGGHRVGFVGLALLKLFSGRFSRAEKLTMAGLLVVIVVSLGALAIWRDNVGTEQPLRGGVFVEGIIGKPQIINPLYARANTVEGDLVRLIFAGLVKINASREFEPDLAESWEVQNKGKTYLFKLKENLKWQDGEKLDADDVVFSIQIMQNESYTGPYRTDWMNTVVTAIDDRTIKIDLPDPSTFFLAKATIGIIPSHLFALLPVAEISEPTNNTKPIGAGPYHLASLASGTASISLEPNQYYYTGTPLIDKIVFNYFDSEKELWAALANGNITAGGFSNAVSSDDLSLPSLNKYIYPLPQYRAIFFNQLGENKILADVNVRQALAYATNKEKIIKEVAAGNAEITDSPILAGFWGNLPDIKKYDYDLSAAANALMKAGWKDIDDDKILENSKQKLSFTLTFKDDKSNTAMAEILKESWQAIGAEVKLNPVSSNDLVNIIIRPRNYEVLIFGQSLGADSDPYAYWHSSQTADPGLALSVMYDKDIDNPLEMARLSSDLGRAISYYHNFQNAFAKTVPAILLYQPNYTYLVDNKVKGTTASINISSTSDRFMNIEKWYIRS
ncbi:peptide ABC transporter substrate-binding protein, partial [Patescibacteria group bacterium]|nr:peptide ABC transporter substrate-binding protein [Patescibacteria group bacterium]